MAKGKTKTVRADARAEWRALPAKVRADVLHMMRLDWYVAREDCELPSNVISPSHAAMLRRRADAYGAAIRLLREMGKGARRAR